MLLWVENLAEEGGHVCRFGCVARGCRGGVGLFAVLGEEAVFFVAHAAVGRRDVSICEA